MQRFLNTNTEVQVKEKAGLQIVYAHTRILDILLEIGRL